MAGKQITEKQIGVLEKFDISTKNLARGSASSIIGFVLKGNGASTGKTPIERANHFKAMEKKWVGQKFLLSETNTATIIRIIPRTKNEICSSVESISSNPYNKSEIKNLSTARKKELEDRFHEKPSPFKILVEYSDKKRRTMSVVQLKKCSQP